jgi:hypothetical protein
MKEKRGLVFSILFVLCLNTSNSFAQDFTPLLKQVIDDYKIDPILGDSNWKGKQIEITAKIVFFDQNEIMVEQRFESSYYNAWIQFKDSGSRTLAFNWDIDSEIKIKGTITGIDFNNNGSINCVIMNDCIIIK